MHIAMKSDTHKPTYHFTYALSLIMQAWYTAQLQGNICTCPRCVPDMSCTHSKCVPHVFWTCPASGKKGVAVTYVLLQLYREVLHLHRCVLCTSQTHLVCVPDASCTRSRCILYVFEHYLGAELYCIRKN